MWKMLLCQRADSDKEQEPEPSPSPGRVVDVAPTPQRARLQVDPPTDQTPTPTLKIDDSVAVDRTDGIEEAELAPTTIIPNSVQTDEPSSIIVPTRCPPLTTTTTTSTDSGQEEQPDLESSSPSDRKATTTNASSLSSSPTSTTHLCAQLPLLAKLHTPASSSSSSSPVVSHTLTPPTPVDSPVRLQTHGWPIENAHTLLAAPNSPLRKSTLLPIDALREENTPEPSSASRSGATGRPPTLSTPRRSSSGASGTGRNYKETLNAYAVEDEDGVRSVNQYVLSKDKKGPLGKGSYATVERATDRETGIEYAMKEFSKRRLRQIAASEQARRERMAGGGRGRGRGRGRGGSNMAWKRACTQDFDDKQGSDNLDLVRTEIAIMKKIKHPCIATIHEVLDVTSDDALLIVMELCAGGPILRIEAGKQTEPMPLDEARRVFQQLVLGVAYLHHNHIIHRDIKPDNCLFMADKQSVKLIDFGISKFTAETADKLDAKGSPAYMPPELLGAGAGQHEHAVEEAQVVRHRQDVHGYASDVWSLGVTLYALVTGQLPFDDVDATQLFHQIKNIEPTYPPHLPPSLRNLLSRMLEKDLHKRISIKEIWDDPWTNQEGEERLIPYEENCVDLEEPTREEVERALNVYRASTFLAMSVVAKLKGKRRVSQDSSRGGILIDEEGSDKGPTNGTSHGDGSGSGSLNGGGEGEGSQTPAPGTPSTSGEQASRLVSSPAESPRLEEPEEVKGLEGLEWLPKEVGKAE
ncbi:BQ2448_2858 [Microbotryum intermedium]|uniref:BQ2448_2858 protein n=1 Tax=Microbotryum intermedium TaxID=269621 RepID=A0A238FBP9_9BASI|nr:BQ2448_2858 [Microbotryum intermedium]